MVAFNDLDDVNVPSPSDGDLARYDSATGQWEKVATSELADPGVDTLVIWDDSAGSIVNGTVGTGLAIAGTTVQIDTSWPGQAAITTVGTITTGTWQGTDVGVAHGGTGASTAAAARTNLGLVIGTDVQAFDALLDDIADLTDPGADRILFWDDTAGIFTWLTVGSGLSITATTMTATGLADVVDDTTPQLGGSLDVNGNKIVSTSGGNIDIEPNGTGNVLLGNFTFDADQTVGAGQDNYVLTYDNATGLISLEASAGGGGGGHTIQDNGSDMTARTNLNLYGDVSLADDSGDDQTDVRINPGFISRFKWNKVSAQDRQIELEDNGKCMVDGVLQSWSTGPQSSAGTSGVDPYDAEQIAYVYLDNAATPAITVESTAPTYNADRDGFYKTGDTTKRMVGAVKVTSDGGTYKIEPMKITVRGRTVQVCVDSAAVSYERMTIISAGTQTSDWDQVDISTFAPKYATAWLARVKFEFNADEDDASIGIAPEDPGAVAGNTVPQVVRMQSATSASGVRLFLPVLWMPITTDAPDAYYRMVDHVESGANEAYIDCCGFEMQR